MGLSVHQATRLVLLFLVAFVVVSVVAFVWVFNSAPT
jgi:hypothetical protein